MHNNQLVFLGIQISCSFLTVQENVWVFFKGISKTFKCTMGKSSV